MPHRHHLLACAPHQIFVQVGLIISLSCIVSVIYAALLLPAMMATCGPEHMRRPCCYRVVALVIITVVFGAILGILAALQASGTITLQNPDGTPWGAPGGL